MAIQRVDNGYAVNPQDWYGVASDFARYISEQLAGSSDKTAASSATSPDGGPHILSYGPNLTYHGGYLLQNPTVYNIYVGDFFKTADGQNEIQYNDGFARQFDTSSSSIYGVLDQYGVGTSTFGGSTVIGGNPTTVSQADIQNYIQQALASGAVPTNPQGIYNVVLPPGVVLVHGRETSTLGLGGFHGSFYHIVGTGPHDGMVGMPVYYSAIVYSQGRNGIDFTGDPAENITITESHEWAETMTDPDVNSQIPGHSTLGWYADPNTSAVSGEIGDLAIDEISPRSLYQRDSAGYMEQLLWSNRDGLYEIAQGSGIPSHFKPTYLFYL